VRSDATIEIRTLRGRDVRSVVDALTRAFWGYPESVHLLPQEIRRRRVLPRYLLSDAIDAARFDTLVVAFLGGAVVGAAAWLPPPAYPISTKRQLQQLLPLVPVLPWAIGAASEGRRGQGANRAHHRRLPPHFYLRAIGVDPAHQGRGIGASLLDPILARADREGVGCFLTTCTPDNARWYEGHGFTTRATYKPTTTWPQTWAMWREPEDVGQLSR
jgi:GNAT superfamily N-acetyltransferase